MNHVWMKQKVLDFEQSILKARSVPVRRFVNTILLGGGDIDFDGCVNECYDKYPEKKNDRNQCIKTCEDIYSEEDSEDSEDS